MKIIETALPGVIIVEPRIFEDARGYFQESWHQTRYAEVGLPGTFVQDNLSFSTKGVLRGLHYQNPQGQGKLVCVLQGEVFDAAVDIRIGSPTFGKWTGSRLSEANKRQMYIPPGFAHGYCVLSEKALFMYKCTEYYQPSSEAGILWNDPDLGIAWPVRDPILSAKDRAHPRLCDMSLERMPVFGGKSHEHKTKDFITRA